MRNAKWEQYEIIDASEGERLERWGEIILIRPDPQIIWKTPKTNPLWEKAHARYIRSNTGGGAWEAYKKIPDVFSITREQLKFNLKTMGFKHTGLFPEQAVNWDFMQEKIKANKDIKVLNMFAYTGGATLACANAGASVCHVDASKGMVSWAKDNAKISGLEDKPIRWIVDDCIKFAAREIRRGSKYDAVIMDPPSYGRGPSGEIWKIETEIYDLLKMSKQLLSDNPLFVVINSYTAGLSGSVMSYMLNVVMTDKFKQSKFISDEIGLKVTSSGLILPCGSSAIIYN
jgi:Predicted SAM-dependent methyltransferases